MGRKRHRVEDATTPPAAKKQKASDSQGNETPNSIPQPSPAQFLEFPQGEELKREVQLYEQLSSEDDAERLKAGNAIVCGLLGGNGVSEAVLTRHLERKLFRGLASGRKAARLGFSVVLTEILGQLFGDEIQSREQYVNLTFEKLLDFLSTKTKPQGDLSGQEERDHAFGLLFGLQCFVRAKVLFQKGEERWEKPLEMLLRLAEEKTWMREECGWVIVEALRQMERSHAERTVQKLYDAGFGGTPEGVGLWLVARERFPDMKFPDKPWGRKGNPLEHLKALSKVLRQSTSVEGDAEIPQARQTGHWNPKLHFVWHLLIDIFLDGIGNGDMRIFTQFEYFWKTAVDENLFSTSASPERKYWGFQLLQKLLLSEQRLQIVDVLFSKNLMRSLINHLSKNDRYLFRAADRSVKVMFQAVQEDPDLRIPVLLKLISGYGTFDFDRVTKTKTVEKLITEAEGIPAGNVVQSLLNCALENQADSHWKILGDFILSMIRNVHLTDETKDISWVKSEALPVLAFLAYCKNRFKIEPELNEKSRTLLQGRLTSAFAHLSSQPQGFLYPCDLLLDHHLVPDAISMDSPILAAGGEGRRIMKKAYKKARKSIGREKKLWESFSLLYSLVIFQLYNGEADAIDLLGELKLCYDGLIEKSETAVFGDEASVVLVEILLSLISKPSVLFRKAAQQVFTAFCHDLTEGGIKLMTDILGFKENSKGQEALFDRDEQDDEQNWDQDSEQDREQEDENVELNSDEESMTVKGALIYGEGEDGEEMDDGDKEAYQKLDRDLAEALGTRPAHQDISAESSNDDVDMTDSEMIALDTKLVEIFSQRKNALSKKEKKDARSNIINLKNRVLDLLHIYSRKFAGTPSYSLLLPLLHLIRTTTSMQIRGKARNIITHLIHSSRGFHGLEREILPKQFQILEKIHAEAGKSPAQGFALACSSASLIVASSIYKTDRHRVDDIASIYHRSQLAWLQGKATPHAVFFHGWVNWCQSHACRGDTPPEPESICSASPSVQA